MRLGRPAALCVPLCALVLTAWFSEPARSAPPPWCLPLQDPEAGHLLVQTRHLATSTAETATELRDTLAAMPMVVPSEVALVSDELLCQRASAALDSFYYAAPQMKAVYLARAGARFAIHPPVDGEGGIFMIIHVD